MAVQLGVAYSKTFQGVGIFAGGPYNCARGSITSALTTCMDPPLHEGPPITELEADTLLFQNTFLIDPVLFLRNTPIYIYSGSLDTIVHPPVVHSTEKYFQHFVSSGLIKSVFDINSEHTFPTLSSGNTCDRLESPYIGSCDYDGAGEMLSWILPSVVSPQNSSWSGHFFEFDQTRFIPLANLHGFSDTGYLYIPPGCRKSTDHCHLHMALHGCEQSYRQVGNAFLNQTGYLSWADKNNILILFPQAHTVPITNPKGCWDWWGYDIDSKTTYMVKSGPQPFALWSMIQSMLL